MDVEKRTVIGTFVLKMLVKWCGCRYNQHNTMTKKVEKF